jgi:hypothetical protein
MVLKILEETEYTNTLNHMIDRQRKILLFNREPMENALREYAYLLDKHERFEYDINHYTISKTEEQPK